MANDGQDRAIEELACSCKQCGEVIEARDTPSILLGRKFFTAPDYCHACEPVIEAIEEEPNNLFDI